MARPRRLTAFPYLGPVRYFLTFCAATRHRAFARREVVTAVLEQIERTLAEQKFSLVAYCFMPDHLHFLIEGQTVEADLKRCARVMRQRTATGYARAEGRRLWQAGYYERVLRDDESTQDVVEYIVGNPVRAGLVDSIVDYPFSGSAVCDLASLWPN